METEKRGFKRGLALGVDRGPLEYGRAAPLLSNESSSPSSIVSLTRISPADMVDKARK